MVCLAWRSPGCLSHFSLHLCFHLFSKKKQPQHPAALRTWAHTLRGNRKLHLDSNLQPEFKGWATRASALNCVLGVTPSSLPQQPLPPAHLSSEGSSQPLSPLSSSFPILPLGRPRFQEAAFLCACPAAALQHHLARACSAGRMEVHL